ncbi:MAG TPA: BrxA/BrxB family bacilliredoxin [Saprospiraceae bacterium]|nr:BrxA/BrxB family bacilliredoxin [Saprospiraceae bacterium]
MYPIELVTPIAKDLTDFGFEGLSTPEDVEKVLSEQQGTILLVVNSVCGCAAANARPAVKKAVASGKKPERLVTVFAGVDQDATAKAREFLLPYPPSSPSIALFKDGELIHMVERRHIEGNSAQVIADHLQAVFEQHC